MSKRYAGKVAIVTGSGTGIGAAIAFRIAGEGARVVLADRDIDAAKAVAADIVTAGGLASACQTDIREPEQVEAMLAHARATFGPAHILVNNAGIGAQRHFVETPLEMLRTLLDVKWRLSRCSSHPRMRAT
jgi:NAD(P)-dependent dehydrogenase (short-subunit alcohol dehydrogenase family)